MADIIVTQKHEGKISHVELNIPEKGNALGLNMIRELTKFFQDVPNSPTQTVVLSGRGPHFCSGGDLEWMKLKPETTDLENLNEVSLLYKLFHTIDKCPVPVTGIVQGSVFGGGIGLVSVCDIVLCHQAAQFCFSEIKLSLIPSVISPFVLKKMPFSQARRLMLSGRIFSALEAFKFGLTHFIGDSKDCEEQVTNYTEQFLKYDKTALKQIKELLHTVPYLNTNESKDYCVKALAERRKKPEVLEKINRFLKKDTVKSE